MSDDRSESEEYLILVSRGALSTVNWTIGEMAARWHKRHARGRTDADFGALIGLGGEQVKQRRRVWETFSDVRSCYPHLHWSHFYAAFTWDDATECLTWANEMQATVGEMKAWKYAQRCEPLMTNRPTEGGRLF